MVDEPYQKLRSQNQKLTDFNSGKSRKMIIENQSLLVRRSIFWIFSSLTRLSAPRVPRIHPG